MSGAESFAALGACVYVFRVRMLVCVCPCTRLSSYPSSSLPFPLLTPFLSFNHLGVRNEALLANLGKMGLATPTKIQVRGKRGLRGMRGGVRGYVGVGVL